MTEDRLKAFAASLPKEWEVSKQDKRLWRFGFATTIGLRYLWWDGEEENPDIAFALLDLFKSASVEVWRRMIFDENGKWQHTVFLPPFFEKHNGEPRMRGDIHTKADTDTESLAEAWLTYSQQEGRES